MIYTAALRRVIPRTPAIGLAITFAAIIMLILFTWLLIHCRERWRRRYLNRNQRTGTKRRESSLWDRFHGWLIAYEKQSLEQTYGKREQRDSFVGSFRSSRDMGIFPNSQTAGHTYRPVSSPGSPHEPENSAASSEPAASPGQGEAQHTNPTVPDPVLTRHPGRQDYYMAPESSTQAQARNRPNTMSPTFGPERCGVQQQTGKLVHLNRASPIIVYDGNINRLRSVPPPNTIDPMHRLSAQSGLYGCSERGSIVEEVKEEGGDPVNDAIGDENCGIKSPPGRVPTDPNDKKHLRAVPGAAAQDVKLKRRARESKRRISRASRVSGDRQGWRGLKKLDIAKEKPREMIGSKELKMMEMEMKDLWDKLEENKPAEKKSAEKQLAEKKLPVDGGKVYNGSLEPEHVVPRHTYVEGIMEED
jgi:hypothetical protein